MIPLGMAEWCIPFCVSLTLTLTSGLISRFFVLYYSLLSSNVTYTGPHSAVGNVSGSRCEFDCRSRGREFDPGRVPYFGGD